MICQYCKKKFEKTSNNQKFCSKLCQQRNYRKEHKELLKERDRGYELKRREKRTNKFCAVCGEKIKRAYQSITCSKICANKRISDMDKKRLQKIQKLYDDWRLKQGCLVCGYNKCAGSLQLHHTRDKISNLNCKDWYYKTKVWREDYPKCILICSNCHGEITYGNRID